MTKPTDSTVLTVFVIECPLCLAKWGTAEVHWGQPTSHRHFTRVDGTHPDEGAKAEEPCPSCDMPFNILRQAIHKARLALEHAAKKADMLAKAMSGLPPTGTSQ